MLFEKKINGNLHKFNDDLSYGELLACGDRTNELWAVKMVAALSEHPKLTVEDLLNIPSKIMTKIMAEVLNNYSKDFPTPPKTEEE